MQDTLPAEAPQAPTASTRKRSRRRNDDALLEDLERRRNVILERQRLRAFAGDRVGKQVVRTINVLRAIARNAKSPDLRAVAETCAGMLQDVAV